MNPLARLGLARPAAGGPRCGSCRYFEGDPHALEAALPGLTVLSSALGSVRGDDGLCDLHGRMVRARAGCDGHRARVAARVD